MKKNDLQGKKNQESHDWRKLMILKKKEISLKNKAMNYYSGSKDSHTWQDKHNGVV